MIYKETVTTDHDLQRKPTKDFLRIARPGPAKWFSKRGGQIVSFLKKCRPPWLADEENFRVYFALDGFILNCFVWNRIINNTWNIPFFTFIEQKNCQLTFLTSNIEHKPHGKSDFINLPKY